jgi:transcription antitermination factor NusG
MCELAAFPGYVFCHFNLRDKARVLDSPGVLEIVSVSGKPAAVADREIEAVRRMMNQGARPVPYFACGQRVKIEYGALAGIEGILTRTESAHELTLSIKLLQRSISLSVDPDQVSIISKF